MSFESPFLKPGNELYEAGRLDYATRIDQAIRKPPNDPFVYTDGLLTQDYQDALHAIEITEIENGICNHGWQHSMHAARNALFLADAAHARLQAPDSKLDPEGNWQDVVSDPLLLFVILKSDIHYGDSDAIVQNGSYPDHAMRSADEVVDMYYRHVPTGTETPADSLIHDHIGILQPALGINLEAAVSYGKRLKQQDSLVTPEQLFPLLIKLADTFDLFRASRVERVKPEFQQNNPYYQLALSVQNYTLRMDGPLTYEIEFNQVDQPAAPDGKPLNFLPTWFNYAQQNVQGDRDYVHVWELASTYAELLGTQFYIRDSTGQMTHSPALHGPSLDNYVVR